MSHFFPRKLYVIHCVKGRLVFFVGNKIKTHSSSLTIKPLKLYMYVSFLLRKYDSAFKFTKSSMISKKGRNTKLCMYSNTYSLILNMTKERRKEEMSLDAFTL